MNCFSRRSRGWGNLVLRVSDGEKANPLHGAQIVVAAAATTSPGTLGVFSRYSSCICGRPGPVTQVSSQEVGPGWNGLRPNQGFGAENDLYS